MSYLEMIEAPIENMSSGVISLWFRDARQNPPPLPQEWPSGLWSPGTSSMVPPNVIEVAKGEAFEQTVFYWNAYGTPITGGGVTLPLFQSPSVMIPTPPPLVTNEMHMMLTFGSEQQSYNYCPWVVTYPDVIEAVRYVPAVISGPTWSVPDNPPPYAPYIEELGKFKVATFELSGADPKPNLVPQSFIGIDKNGYLTICLQTDTRASYQGYAFQLDKVTEIRATQSWYDRPPGTPPGAPGVWRKVSGYWDGYEFWYTDVSNEVMGAQPETFVIGGPPAAFDFTSIPPISDGAWHHLLFSFEISGAVHLELPPLASGGARPPPVVNTTCKAWLALDDKNYSGAALQHRFAMHDGFQLPLLPGMGSDATGFGPVTSSVRANMNLEDNDILPRNCWIISFRNIPREGLLRFASNAGLWNEESTVYIQKGDFNWFNWTAGIWSIFGEPGATDWRGSVDPPRPTTPDPKENFSVPTYHCSGFSIPVNGSPVGIPASSHHLEHNTGIEMAELQIWANRTLDTANVSNRRLFVDKDGKPVPPKQAEEQLGKPDIKLRGASNWKSGKNTGSAGDFNPVAKIEKFLPNAQLRK